MFSCVFILIHIGFDQVNYFHRVDLAALAMTHLVNEEKQTRNWDHFHVKTEFFHNSAKKRPAGEKGTKIVFANANVFVTRVYLGGNRK